MSDVSSELRVAAAIEQLRGPVTRAPHPTASVVVATHNRAAFLAELVGALSDQDAPDGGFEVVIADDGSTDETWSTLQRLVSAAAVPVLGLRLPPCGGPSVPRNTATAAAEGRFVVMTDDDCLPRPGWLRAHVAALAAGAGITQGRTEPHGARQGDWDRTIDISRFTGLYETCNLALSRELFLRLGGFPVDEGAAPGARGFGEDVLLGVAAARAAGARWVPEAVVGHRWLPGTYVDHLRERRRLRGFPALLRDEPSLRELLVASTFLSRRTAAYDAAVAGALTAWLRRRPGPLLAALPWLMQLRRDAGWRPGRPVGLRMAQLALADTVAAASLVEGSVRSREVLL